MNWLGGSAFDQYRCS